VNLEKREANMIDVTNMRLAVFDINTLDQISDAKISDKSKFF